MKITINGKEINLTDEQLATLKEEIKKEEEWPKYNDEYWLLHDTGTGDSYWDSHPTDIDRQKRGNIYRTKEEVEKADQKRIALATIWAYWEKNCKWEVDWENDTQKKYEISYEHKFKRFSVWLSAITQSCPFLPVYDSTESARQALEDIEAEYKLLFDVV